jgi:Zn-dependent protease with chaperone function
MDLDAIRRIEAADRERSRIRAKTWIKGIAIAAIVVIAGFWTIGLVVDAIVSSISEETEAEWFAGLDIGCTQPELEVGDDYARAEAIFAKLVASGDLRPLPFRLCFVEMDVPNAFAVPGGAVGITGPLLANVESEKGLAMVLAHELGHQQHRHSLKRIGRSLAIGLGLALLFGDNAGLASRVIDLASLSHSREQEREADRFGLELVQQTFGDTEGALEFFEFVARNDEEGSIWGSLLQTHPLTTERLEYLREMQREIAAAPAK